MLDYIDRTQTYRKNVQKFLIIFMDSSKSVLGCGSVYYVTTPQREFSLNFQFFYKQSNYNPFEALIYANDSTFGKVIIMTDSACVLKAIH